jgi:PDDEXK-like domain of unknown function (DUF3799)
MTPATAELSSELAAALRAPPSPGLLDLEPGLYDDVSPEVYYGRYEGLARHSIMELMLDAPVLARAWYDGGEEESSPALDFGVAFHMAALEPDRFAATYAVEPDFGDCRANARTGTTKEEGARNREARDAWRAAHAGAKYLSDEDAVRIRGMVEALHAHPVAGPIVKYGRSEVTCRWRDKATGIECAARGDKWHEDLAWLYDLKGLEDASWDGFRMASERYGFHRQEAHYRMGWATTGNTIGGMGFVCVRKRAPHLIGLYEHEPSDIEAGAAANRRALVAMAEALKTGVWPGYQTGFQTVKLRPWAL